MGWGAFVEVGCETRVADDAGGLVQLSVIDLVLPPQDVLQGESATVQQLGVDLQLLAEPVAVAADSNW
jgi:hypothetical protein